MNQKYSLRKFHINLLILIILFFFSACGSLPADSTSADESGDSATESTDDSTDDDDDSADDSDDSSSTEDNSTDDDSDDDGPPDEFGEGEGVSCEVTADCPTFEGFESICASFSSGDFCTVACDSDDDCGDTSLTCQETGEGDSACLD